MPNLDRTGPRGLGPLTGRGLGPCGMGMFGWRGGFGRGGGLGRGLSRFFEYSPTKEDLQNYKKALQEEIEDIDNALKES